MNNSRIKEIMRKVKPAIELLYDSTITVKRNEEYEKPNGATGHRYNTLYENIACKKSKKDSQLSNIAKTAEVANVDYDLKIFTSNDYAIKAGDEIFDETMHLIGYAKEPFAYTNHQEFYIDVEWEA